MLGTYYVIEEWIPPEHAIGGRGFWTKLEGDEPGVQYRTWDKAEAERWFRKIRSESRRVRVVEVTETVIVGE